MAYNPYKGEIPNKEIEVRNEDLGDVMKDFTLVKLMHCPRQMNREQRKSFQDIGRVEESEPKLISAFDFRKFKSGQESSECF